MLAELNAQVTRFMATSHEDPWHDAYRGLSRGEMWLTEEETREFIERFRGLQDEFRHRASPTERPAGARRASLMWSLVPLDPPPE